MRFRILGSLTLALLLGGAMTAVAAKPNEKLTDLPVHPGLRFQQEIDSPVCGKNANMNLYGAPMKASLEEYISWYKQQLKNFHYVHQVWGDRAQELFYSPDGSKSIGITGIPDGKGVFAVTYMKFSSNLTAHQQEEFSPSNPGCK